MTVELRLLRSLVTLVDDGHVGRAAERLHLSQPALSKQIAALERSTGMLLFVRHAKGVTPTEAGKVLADRARRLLHDAEEFDALVARTRRSLTGRLQLGFIAQAANEHTPDLLRAFRHEHPEVTVEMRQYDMSDLAAGLREGSTDLAILRHPVGFPDLAHEPLLLEPRVVVLPVDHPLAGRSAVSITELLDDVWVRSASSDPAYQAFALADNARGGRPARTGPVVRGIDEYLEAVLAHQGIGLAPQSAGRYYSRPGITYVAVPDAEPSVASLSWSTRRPLSAPAHAMLELVRTLLPLAA